MSKYKAQAQRVIDHICNSTQLIVFFEGAKGDYLHSYRTTEPFTDKVKEAAALDCLKAYNEKTA